MTSQETLDMFRKEFDDIYNDCISIMNDICLEAAGQTNYSYEFDLDCEYNLNIDWIELNKEAITLRENIIALNRCLIEKGVSSMLPTKSILKLFKLVDKCDEYVLITSIKTFGQTGINTVNIKTHTLFLNLTK